MLNTGLSGRPRGATKRWHRTCKFLNRPPIFYALIQRLRRFMKDLRPGNEALHRDALNGSLACGRSPSRRGHPREHTGQRRPATNGRLQPAKAGAHLCRQLLGRAPCTLSIVVASGHGGWTMTGAARRAGEDARTNRRQSRCPMLSIRILSKLSSAGPLRPRDFARLEACKPGLTPGYSGMNVGEAGCFRRAARTDSYSRPGPAPSGHSARATTTLARRAPPTSAIAIEGL
jgi:hypothetical protein